MKRHDTHPGWANGHDSYGPKGDTMSKPLKIASFVLALLIAFGALLSTVYAVGQLVASKADKTTVNQIRTDVEIIKTEQRMLIRAIRPGLLGE